MKKNEWKIPKVIHYCWFGGNDLGENEKRCIDSWKKIMPDYEIKRWDESNYDCKKNDFICKAYEAKKWAFVSDYARLDIIYNNGGIYLDTDVEVIKRFDNLLIENSFWGFESDKFVANGLGFGAIPYNEIVKENLDYYNNLVFDLNNLNNISCPKITTYILKKHGLLLNNHFQKLDFATVYSKDFFCPMDYYTGELHITENTYSVHHYSMSWLSQRDKRWYNFSKKLSKIMGAKVAFTIVYCLKIPGSVLIKLKKDGWKQSIQYFYRIIKEKIKCEKR